VVTVHEGDSADAETRSVNAEAFTRNGEIFLAGDAPLTSERGQQLLAHELSHVVQQRGGATAMPDESTGVGRDMEQEAVRAERAMESAAEAPALHHRPNPAVAAPAVQPHVPEGIQRAPREEPRQEGSDFTGDSAPALTPGSHETADFTDASWRSRAKEAMQQPWATSLYSLFEIDTSATPFMTDETNDMSDEELYRLAHRMYPITCDRLRAEMLHERERRGRMMSEWR